MTLYTEVYSTPSAAGRFNAESWGRMGSQPEGGTTGTLRRAVMVSTKTHPKCHSAMTAPHFA